MTREEFQRLCRERIVFLDGATGTNLQKAGMPTGVCPEAWILEHPDTMMQLQKAYFEAGSDIVLAPTFTANRIKLDEYGLVDKIEEMNHQLVAISKAAAGDRGLVAGDMTMTGRQLAPMGDMGFEELIDIYKEQAGYLVDAGVDLFVVETMMSLNECRAALIAIREVTDLPVCVTLSFNEDGRTLFGTDACTAMVVLQSLGADAVGVNCSTGPEQMAELVREMKAYANIPVIAKPNDGMPEVIDGETVYRMTPEEFAAEARLILEAGAGIVGGCCGTTPEHIAQMIAKCKTLQPGGTRDCRLTAVSSYGKAVHLGEGPIIIGERINPTGKKRLKEALVNSDLDYVCRLGLEQIGVGAQILDVNVGTPGIDEAAMAAKAVPALQAITDTPLQIDTSNYEAMEKALRLYNGKPMLNSVNGKEDSLQHVLPLAKKYGAVLVALCLDDNGIPATAAGRIAVAEKIIARAAEYGIESRNIVVDPLALTISTGADNAAIACEVIRTMKARGINTVMGVSNISFGLPGRDAVNSTFFSMAMAAGLSCGIINPQSKPMMDAYYGYRALAGYDEGCKEYVQHYADAPKAAATTVSEMGLYDAIVKGLQGPARQAAAKALESEKPLDIINKYMIPALDFVGHGFEKKTLFLPQLLMSADAAKAAFEVIREAVGVGETQGETVIIATVHGDIHDIGKNIVKVLLENYGYRVLDLGKDVPVEAVVEAAKKTDAKVVGLSALMTTTVGAMEETIAALHNECDCQVVVGGAVLTQEYADTIGAEHYAPNAVSAVNYVNEILGK